jgi:hypothetical protein
LTTFSEESDNSGSDYGEQREALLNQRRKKAERGKVVSDTESEDEALDRELSVEAFPETPGASKTGSKAAEGKGASPAQEFVAANDVDDEDPDGTWEIVSGPFSNAARLEAQQFGLLVSEMAEKIARKYKKSRREVMLAAGLGVRAARARNPFNMFKKWYAHHHSRGTSEYRSYGAW